MRFRATVVLAAIDALAVIPVRIVRGMRSRREQQVARALAAASQSR